MRSRLDFHEELCRALGSRNVYFQAPSNVTMKYPAIRYSLSKFHINHANDKKYRMLKAYEVILIHKDPDNTIVEELMKFEYCSFNSFYVADNLNHYSFTIYY